MTVIEAIEGVQPDGKQVPLVSVRMVAVDHLELPVFKHDASRYFALPGASTVAEVSERLGVADFEERHPARREPDRED